MKNYQRQLQRVAGFVQAAAAKVDVSKVKEMLAQAPKLFEIIANVKILAPYMVKVKVLFQLTADYFYGRYKTKWHHIAMIVATLLYIINPLDLIPDVIPIIGYLDDLAALVFLLRSLGSELNRYKEWHQVNAG